MLNYGDGEDQNQKDYKNAVYKAQKEKFGKELPREELIRLAFAAGVHKFHPDGVYHYPIDDRYWPVIRQAKILRFI